MAHSRTEGYSCHRSAIIPNINIVHELKANEVKSYENESDF
jgi:hypothetical protein